PVTLALLTADSLAEAFDDSRTPETESAGDLARAAFARALEHYGRARDALVSPRDEGVLSWGRYRPVSIPHLLKLDPLGIGGLAADGCGECVNAQRGSHGPSWRMAV